MMGMSMGTNRLTYGNMVAHEYIHMERQKHIDFIHKMPKCVYIRSETPSLHFNFRHETYDILYH